MKDEVNPVMNHALHARAEQAALEAYHAAPAEEEYRRLMHRMDRAASRVFRTAGTPRDVAAFYGQAVTSLVLERLEHARRRAEANRASGSSGEESSFAS